MKQITAYIKTNMLQKVTLALHGIEDISGVTVCDVKGFGRTHERKDGNYSDYHPHIKIEMICADGQVEQIVKTIQENAHTGLRGDGKISIIEIEQLIRISNGEGGESAL